MVLMWGGSLIWMLTQSPWDSCCYLKQERQVDPLNRPVQPKSGRTSSAGHAAQHVRARPKAKGGRDKHPHLHTHKWPAPLPTTGYRAGLIRRGGAAQCAMPARSNPIQIQTPPPPPAAAAAAALSSTSASSIPRRHARRPVFVHVYLTVGTIRCDLNIHIYSRIHLHTETTVIASRAHIHAHTQHRPLTARSIDRPHRPTSLSAESTGQPIDRIVDTVPA